MSNIKVSELPEVNSVNENDILMIIQDGVNKKAQLNKVVTDKVENEIKTNIVTGEETATNEYLDGKIVYVKRINFGTLPSATTETIEKTVSTGLNQNNVDIVKVDGIATGSVTSASYVLILPDINPMDYKQATRITMDTENDIWRIKIRVGVDRSNYTAYINVYYTKK